MYGGRVSLTVGFVVIILETVLGVFLGGLAGYFGKWVDQVIMRIVDIFNCVPTMPMMMIVGVALDKQDISGPAKLYIMMAMLTLFGWAGTARLVRGQILSLREQDFMLSAEASGLTVGRKIFRHLIPNVMPQLIVSMTLGLGGIILTEATLGYLGIGLPAEYATWGQHDITQPPTTRRWCTIRTCGLRRVSASCWRFWHSTLWETACGTPLTPKQGGDAGWLISRIRVALPQRNPVISRVPTAGRYGGSRSLRKTYRRADCVTQMKDPRNVVEFDDLHTYFFTDNGVVKAVNGVSFDIPQGATVGVVGESGCGKSVTSLSLMQLVQAPMGQVVSGSIRFRSTVREPAGVELCPASPAG